MTFDVPTEVAAIRDLLVVLEGVLEWPDERRSAVAGEVSGWSAGQHVELALHAVAGALAATRRLASGGDEVRGSPSALVESSRRILDSGKIPRSVARVTEGLGPAGVSSDELRTSLQEQRLELEQIEGLAAEVPLATDTMPHPVLGQLDALEWLRFTRVITEHHVEIIRDIVVALVRGRSPHAGRENVPGIVGGTRPRPA